MGAWAWKSTSLPRYVTFRSSTPDPLVPEDAAGRVTRKLQSVVPPWVMVNWYWPAVFRDAVLWAALGKPQAGAAARALSGARPSNRDTVRWIMFTPMISWRSSLL